MDSSPMHGVRRISEELTRYRDINVSNHSASRQKGRNMFPPQAQNRFAKLFRRALPGGSENSTKDPDEIGQSRPGSSRRPSLDLERRSKVPPPITKDDDDPTAAGVGVSPLAVDSGQHTVRMVPQSECHPSQAWLNKEHPEIPGSMVPAGDFEETDTSATASLQKTRTAGEGHAGSRKLLDEKQQLEDKSIRHDLGVKQDHISLRQEFQGVQQTSLEAREHQRSDQQAMQYQRGQRAAGNEKGVDVYQQLKAAQAEINNWFLRYNELDSKSKNQDLQITTLRGRIGELSEEKAASENEINNLRAQCQKQKVSEEKQEPSDAHRQSPADIPHELTQGAEEQVPMESKLMIDNERLRYELHRLVQQKASEVVTTDQYFYHDDYFKTEFNSLRASIKNWANRAFSSESTKVPRKLSEVIQNDLIDTHDGYDLYLKSIDHRRSFVQAYIWGYLLRKVFGQKMWKPLRPSTSFYAEVKKFHTSSILTVELTFLRHQHRYAAARLAVPKGTETQAIDTNATQRIAQGAKYIQESLDVYTSMAKGESIKLLQGIVRQATCLDLSMNQQKASFEIVGKAEIISKYDWQSAYKIPYDSKAMEVRFGGESRLGRQECVELFITPMLVKTGTADGQNFDSSIVIVKAEVDTERLRSMRSKMSFFSGN